MTAFRSILPPNSLLSERALEQATAEPILALDTDMPRTVKNPDTCPVSLLPWLAWEYAVDYWEADWTEQQKRQVIRDAAYVHQHRGTPGAVKRALSSVGYTAEIIEWWQESPQQDPYTFRIRFGIDGAISQENYSRIRQQINRAKNLRSYLTGLEVTAEAGVPGEVCIGGAVTMYVDIDIAAG